MIQTDFFSYFDVDISATNPGTDVQVVLPDSIVPPPPPDDN